MRLGIAKKISASSPDEWAAKCVELGIGAVIFPKNSTCTDAEIDSPSRWVKLRGIEPPVKVGKQPCLP